MNTEKIPGTRCLPELALIRGAEKSLPQAEVEKEFLSARDELGLKIGERAVFFPSSIFRWEYALRDEISGGHWKNNPHVCAS